MSWATTSELRALISTTLSDSDLQNILDIAQTDVESDTSSTNYHAAHLNRAIFYIAIRMKLAGELPDVQKVGPLEEDNHTDKLFSLLEDEKNSLQAAKPVFLYYVRAKPNFRDDTS